MRILLAILIFTMIGCTDARWDSMVSEHYEKEKTGEVSGKYLDMKNGGVLRPWNNN